MRRAARPPLLPALLAGAGALSIALGGCTARKSAPEAGGAAGNIAATSQYAPVAAALEPFIRHERAQKGIPAISVALVDGQHIVWAQGFGMADSAAGVPATAETVYRVGSVSKLFTDIGIMQLVEKGKLDLDAPVERYVPEFHPRNPFGTPITIRELTSHLAGLTREPPVGNYFDDTEPSLRATVESLDSTTLVYAPRTHTKYSNAGIAVLGYVLEKTQGESFYPYLKKAVLDPMGLAHSAFQPLPALQARLAKAYMWSWDGKRFEAPTFQLGIGPAGSLYTTVEDMGRFMSVLFDGGRSADGRQIVTTATLDSMWTPQFTPAGQTSGYGIGFHIGTLDGHRAVGHDGAIYGFATALEALPDDRLGVVVVATLDGANTTADRIAAAALRMMLAQKAGTPLPVPDTTRALPPGRALALQGRYAAGGTEAAARAAINAAPTHDLSSGSSSHFGAPEVRAVDLTEYEGRLYLMPLRGGSRAEIRQAADGGLIVDDALDYGQRIGTPTEGRIVIGADTLSRVPTRRPVALVTDPQPAQPDAAFTGLIGEYGWDHDVLYILEKDGRLNALIEWFTEYPLTRVSKDVYAFPHWGLYDGQKIVFHRDAHGQAYEAVAANVRFRRRPLPGDDNAVSFRITPVKPVAELRKEALAAHPPAEKGEFRKPDLVELRSLDPTIRYEIRYAGTNNFMGAPFYTSSHAFMQRPAAEAVARVSAKLRALGYGLLVHDAYRPWYVTKMFWDGTPVDKHDFVADPSQGSRHNRGCAVDITLYDLGTGRSLRMPGGYDEMSERSFPLYPGGTSLQRWQRDVLRHAMESEGFNVYEFEWWHFDYKDWRHYPILNVRFEDLARTSA